MGLIHPLLVEKYMSLLLTSLNRVILNRLSWHQWRATFRCSTLNSWKSSKQPIWLEQVALTTLKVIAPFLPKESFKAMLMQSLTSNLSVKKSCFSWEILTEDEVLNGAETGLMILSSGLLLPKPSFHTKPRKKSTEFSGWVLTTFWKTSKCCTFVEHSVNPKAGTNSKGRASGKV